MQKFYITIFGVLFLMFFAGYIFIPTAIAATSSIDINSIDINKVGESSKSFLSKAFTSIENWWNGSGSSWVKNIYIKITELLNKNIIIK